MNIYREIGRFTKTHLFSCSIYKIRIDPNSYDKEKILKDIKYNKSLKNRRNTKQSFKNCDIHYSYNDFDNEDFRSINYEKLIVVYTEIFEEFFNKEIYTTKSFNWEFCIVNYSAMTEGQWLPSHGHLGSADPHSGHMTTAFACIHYLNFKDGHSFTCFNNPATFAPFLKYIRPEMYNILDMVPDNSYFWEYVDFPVEEDDMLIFPSAINHEVPVQGPTKEPRITISTNLMMKEVA